jgi:hypothetical protein
MEIEYAEIKKGKYYLKIPKHPAKKAVRHPRTAFVDYCVTSITRLILPD